jgi:uncharacterized protein (TIGR03067 family)
MRNCFAALSLVFAPLVAMGDADKEEVKKLAGTWHLVSFEIDGRQELPKDGRLVIQGDTMKTYVGDKLVSESTFSIDPTKKPRTIDWQSIKPKAGIKSIGIYELQGDRLKLCGTEGKDRPTAFTPTKENGWGLSVFRRAKE